MIAFLFLYISIFLAWGGDFYVDSEINTSWGGYGKSILIDGLGMGMGDRCGGWKGKGNGNMFYIINRIKDFNGDNGVVCVYIMGRDWA